MVQRDLALLEAGQRAFRIALGQYLLGLGDQRLQLGLDIGFLALHRQLAQDLVEHRLDLRLGPRGRQVGDELALEHGIDGRDRLDLELRGDELVLVGIDLGEDHALRRIIGRNFLDDR